MCHGHNVKFLFLPTHSKGNKAQEAKDQEKTQSRVNINPYEALASSRCRQLVQLLWNLHTRYSPAHIGMWLTFFSSTHLFPRQYLLHGDTTELQRLRLRLPFFFFFLRTFLRQPEGTVFSRPEAALTLGTAACWAPQRQRGPTRARRLGRLPLRATPPATPDLPPIGRWRAARRPKAASTSAEPKR